ncbi:hypothetical protein [Candidatus Poriferisocius sp.]|uniref:hypothetical protein n=1 Tax=Candidatus Poriferisocius sp. TaxID=3101276 RepID=UPI003B02D969
MALMQRLTEVLGEEEARTLMESLPPTFWYHLATKDDLKALDGRIQAKFDGVDAKFDGVDAKFEGIDAKFEGIDARFEGIDARFEKVDGEFAKVYGEFALVRSEMEKNKGEIALMIANQTRTLVFILVGFAVTIWGSILAVGLN